MSRLTEYKLDELYEMGSGISTKPEQAGHGAPFVSFSSIFNNAILPEELTDLMDTTEEEQEKYSVRKGDILLTRTSETLDELAMSSVAVKDYPNATFSGFAKRLRPLQNNVTYDKFMAYFMRSAYFRKIVNCKAVMTLRASFNEEIFSYIKIELPEYEHQVKCGDLFWDIEQKIRNNDAIIAEIEAMAKTLYDYWFLQFEFPNSEGNPYKSSGGEMKWNEDLKKEIPEGWKTEKLEKVLGKIPTTRKYKSTEYSSGNKFPIIDQSSDYICGYADNEEDVLNLKDCIVFGDHTKVIKYVNFAFIRGADGTQILNSTYESLPNYLLYQQILQMELVTQGYSRYYKFLKDKYVVIPSQCVADKYLKYTENLLEKKRQSIDENKELTSLRDFLLTLLMTGQVGFNEK